MAGTAAGLEVGVVRRVTYGLRDNSLLFAGLSVLGYTPERTFLPNLCVSKSVVPLLRVANPKDTSSQECLIERIEQPWDFSAVAVLVKPRPLCRAD